MIITLTNKQVESIWKHMTNDQIEAYLADNIENSVDIICCFIYKYVHSARLQQEILEAVKDAPVQRELFTD